VRLRDLDVSWTAVTDSSLLLVATVAQESLVKLKARGCTYLGRKSITGRGVMALAACSSLEVLKLYDYRLIENDSLEALAVGCPKMRQLCIPACYALSDAGILAGGEEWARTLRELDLSRIPFVSNACLKMVALRYTFLTNLRVCGCAKVSDDGVLHLATFALQLESLALSSCPLITDHGVIAAMPLFSHLSALEMADCQISDISISHILGTCTSLRMLDVSNCLGVTDASLRALRAGARLQELVLRGCPITTQGLALLLLNRSLALTTIYIEAETIDIESAHLSILDKEKGSWTIAHANHLAGSTKLSRRT